MTFRVVTPYDALISRRRSCGEGPVAYTLGDVCWILLRPRAGHYGVFGRPIRQRRCHYVRLDLKASTVAFGRMEGVVRAPSPHRAFAFHRDRRFVVASPQERTVLRDAYRFAFRAHFVGEAVAIVEERE